jgi:hypothetical protein
MSREIMKNDIFHARGQAEEAAYFHKQDAILLEKLRERAKLSEIAHALAEKLRVDNLGLLERIVALGVTLETGAAFILSPLIEVAWADGDISQAERETIIRMAEDRGIAPDSADMNQILKWLENRPEDAVFRLAVEAIKAGLSVLPPVEAEERVKGMVAGCEEVAAAAGGLRKLLSRNVRISSTERSVLGEIEKCLAV